MTQTTGQDAQDQVVVPTPPASDQQGGAFGGQTYDPNAIQTSVDDFVLDMDDIPDFSLDDIKTPATNAVEEAVAPVIDAPVAPIEATPVAPEPVAPTEEAVAPIIDVPVVPVAPEPVAPIEAAPVAPEPVAPVVDVPVAPAEIAPVTPELVVPEVVSSAVTEEVVGESEVSTPDMSVDDFDLNLDDMASVQNSSETVEEVVIPETKEIVSEVNNEEAISTDDFDLNLDETQEVEEPTEESQDDFVNKTEEALEDIQASQEEIVSEEPITQEVAETQDTEESDEISLDLGDLEVEENIETEENLAATENEILEEVEEESQPTQEPEEVVLDEEAEEMPTVDMMETEGLTKTGSKVAKSIHTIATIAAINKNNDPIRVLAASHGREEVYYEFSSEDEKMTVVRDAVDAEENKSKDTLAFSFDDKNLRVNLDDVTVFDEDSDHDVHTRYENTITDKLGKFQMLLDEKLTEAKESHEERMEIKKEVKKVKKAGKRLQAF